MGGCQQLLKPKVQVSKHMILLCIHLSYELDFVLERVLLYEFFAELLPPFMQKYHAANNFKMYRLLFTVRVIPFQSI